MADEEKKGTAYLMGPEQLIKVFHSNMEMLVKELIHDPQSRRMFDLFLRVNGIPPITQEERKTGNSPYNRLLNSFVKKASRGMFGGMDARDEAAWQDYIHPANFDLPADTKELINWSFLHYLSMAMREHLDAKHMAGENVELEMSGELAGFIVNALPPAVLRDAIQKLELTSNRVGSDARYQADAVFDIITHTKAFNIRREAVDEHGAVVETKGKERDPATTIQHLVDFIATIPDLSTQHTEALRDVRSLPELVERSRAGGVQKELLRTALQGAAKLEPRTIDAYRRVKQGDVSAARRAAVLIGMHMEDKGVEVPIYLRPSYIYNALYETDEAARVHDPIALAWAVKLMHEDAKRRENRANKTRKRVRISLDEAYLGAPWHSFAQGKKPRHAARHAVLLKHIEAQDAPLYSVQHVAAALAGAGANEDTMAAKREFVQRLMDGRAKPASLWRRESKAKDSPLVPTPAYAEFCALFKMDAHAFIPPEHYQPAAAPVIKDAAPPVPHIEPAPRETPHEAPVEVKPEGPKTAADFTREELVFAAASALHATPAQRAILESALHHRPITNGVPSLPHMWMMWAVRPDTRTMPLRALVDAYQHFWAVPAAQRISYEGTVTQQFIWAGVAAMRNLDTLFQQHQDFIARVTADSSKDPHSAPQLGDVLEVLELNPAQMEKNEARKAGKVLDWIDGLDAPHARLFGGGHAAGSYLNRLRAALGRPTRRHG